MKNVLLRPYRHASPFRRVAAAVWGAPREPNVYGSVTVRAKALLRWLARRNEQGGQKVTVTHAVARALGIVLRRHPDCNAFVRRGRLQLREHVDVFLHVLLKDDPHTGRLGDADLSGRCVRQIDRKTVDEIAAELSRAAAAIRGGQDRDFESSKRQIRALPVPLLRASMRALELLQYDLNLDTSWLGSPRDPFGSAEVSSVGMFGVRVAYGPFFPLARTPIAVVVGAVEDEVIAVDGEAVVEPTLVLNGTFDHRVIDGYHAAVLTREVRVLLESPELLDRPVEELDDIDQRAAIRVGSAVVQRV
jgi:pyruvate dehydrogenase E2 component (dihydrolipoamide acetyltransferase)